MTSGSDSQTRLLIYGIGNPGRQDDGLGWAFLEALEGGLPPGVETFRNYQLNIEDAELISMHDRVLFVDASKSQDIQAFRCRAVRPQASMTFTTHHLTIESVLALCQTLYQKTPRVEVLEILGYAWELMEGLTPEARSNLERAVACWRTNLATFRAP